MKKLLISALAAFAISATAHAGQYGMGVSGSLAYVTADGTETTTAGTVGGGTADKHSKSVDAFSGVGSIFVEYIEGPWTVGVDYVPFAADVSSATHERTETAEGTSGTDASGQITRKADAEVEDFTTVYVDYAVGDYFVKVGFSQIDVITKENAITSSGTYGNATLDGYTLGAGFKHTSGDVYYKTSVEYTDFEDLSLTSSTSNKITADLDVTQFKVAVGMAF